MFCPYCGNQNPDGAGFCGFCGSALTQQEIRAKPEEPSTQPAETQPPVNDPTAYAAPPEEAPSRAYEPAEYASTAGREAPPRGDAPKSKKPKKSPLVPILIACVAVLAAGVTVLTVFLLKERKAPKPEPSEPSSESKEAPSENTVGTLLPTEERPTIEVPTVRPEPSERSLPPQLDTSQYLLAATTKNRVYYFEPNWIGDDETWGSSVYSCNYDGSEVVHIADAVDIEQEGGYLVLTTHRSDVQPAKMIVIDENDCVLVDNIYVWDVDEVNGELCYLALPDFDPVTMTAACIEVHRLTAEGDILHGTIPYNGIGYPAWIDDEFAVVYNPNTGENDQYYLFGQNAPN